MLARWTQMEQLSSVESGVLPETTSPSHLHTFSDGSETFQQPSGGALMRKVLWSGSLKHQGASLTAPQPPSSLSNPRAECPNQGRAACAASLANLPIGGSTDGRVRSVGQHAAGPKGVVLERAHAMPGPGCH
ncbi:unnamed protein product [Pleuronectes platessa]|uniref:Uncharacterized protein n=1 Tax=Pleuronectes platessa TaxID=8262 RepID=A0A9N7YFS0_PLEPL|nr:unnamed protein product [Pleuronectes platessa]